MTNPEPVSLSISGLPAGVKATISPDNGLPKFLSLIHISDYYNARPGIYSFNVTGKSASSSQTIQMGLRISKFNGFYIDSYRIGKNTFNRLHDASMNMDVIHIHISIFDQAPVNGDLYCYFPGSFPVVDGNYDLPISDKSYPQSASMYINWINSSAESFTPDGLTIKQAKLSVRGGKMALKIPRITLVSASGKTHEFAANIFEK
ncbi:MAG: hypothetical protein JST27_03665 [Bacteroidetes bacterium]|nr:hypothetical protein [Bacteroidota bacterium]